MAINFPKKQEQRLIPKYLLEYSEELAKNHPDPTAEWGGSGVADIEAGTGIEITGETTKTISVDDETVAMVANLAPVAFSGSYNDLSNKPTIPTNTSDLNNDSGFIANGDDNPQFTNSITLTDDNVYPRYSTSIEKGMTDGNTTLTLPDYSGTLTTEGYVASLISKEWPVIAIPVTYPSQITPADLTTLVTHWPKVLALMDDRYLVPSKYALNQYTFTLVDAMQVAVNNVYKTNHVIEKVTIFEYSGDVYYESYGIDNDYNNLVNKPDLSIYAESADLALVATTGSYNDLSDKPTIPVVDYPVTDVQIAGVSCVTNKVANLPVIPTATSQLYNDSGYLTSVDWGDVTNKPTFATVATTGDYDDLINKPTIPTVGNGTITIKKNNTTVDTFTTNQSTNKSINITVPTDTADLTNGAGFITAAQVPAGWEVVDVYQSQGSTPVSAADLAKLAGDNVCIRYNLDAIGTDAYELFYKKGSPVLYNGYVFDSFNLNYNLGTSYIGFGQIYVNATTGAWSYTEDNRAYAGHKIEAGSGLVEGLVTSYGRPLSIDTSVVALKTDIPTRTSQLTNNSGFITSSALTGYATEQYVQNQGYITGITSSDVTTALGYTPGTSNFSGDYDDLTNKPTIPDAVSGTNDGTYWTTLTIGSDTYALGGGGSTPTNMVTTNTNQNITGEKTFVGDKRIKFKQSTASNKLGFTLYNNSNNEKGYLEYNPSDDGMYLGRYGNYRVNELGFKTSISGSSHKLLVPNVTLSGNVTDYIPISVNNIKADSSGNISIAIPTIPTNVSSFINDAGYITASVSTLTNYYDKTYIDNTIGNIETLLQAI